MSLYRNLLFCVAMAAASHAQQDPFAGVTPATAPVEAPKTGGSWFHNFFHDNFGFREEVMSEFDSNLDGSGASRQSVGFDLLKTFSGATSTVASFDFQGRLVRRDGYNPVPNDMEGASRPGWAFEYHNLYVDFYNIFNPLLGDDGRTANLGRFNFRMGRFYVPFGLNLATDTHGTLLQLSNGDNFGFDEDWFAGFWGVINKDLNYDVYYMAGSGYDLKFKGQSGLASVRISLGNRFSSERGLEGGVSAIGGERLEDGVAVRTQRVGIDGRYRHTAPKGLFTFTTELSGGRDNWNPVAMQLHQAEYLRASRRWGVGTQFRRYYQEGHGANAAMIGEFTWYFRNDVAGSNSHWIKLNIERQLQSTMGPPHTIVTLQYYLYL